MSLDQLIATVNASNSLIAAGALEGGTGRFAVKVPGLIEKPQDVLKVPVAATSGATVTVGDVAQVKPTFKDATSVTRVNGRSAMTIEVSKRTGANLIETVDGVKAAVEKLKATWPDGVAGDLHAGQVEGHPPDAGRPAELGRDRRPAGRRHHPVRARLPRLAVHRHRDPGLVPGGRARACSSRASPINIVVLFSLILAVGMLVDDAIIVSEFAERRMAEGMPPKEAYSLAAKRMSGPVIAATATRVAAFSPLLFWPGVVGEFMKYCRSR